MRDLLRRQVRQIVADFIVLSHGQTTVSRSVLALFNCPLKTSCLALSRFSQCSTFILQVKSKPARERGQQRNQPAG